MAAAQKRQNPHHKAINWEHIYAMLPTEQTPEARAVRWKYFKLFDPNDNKLLSLAEVSEDLPPSRHHFRVRLTRACETVIYSLSLSLVSPYCLRLRVLIDRLSRISSPELAGRV